jgi:hypothetical protein
MLMQIGSFSFKQKIEIFPGPGGWHYVLVPKSSKKATDPFKVRGLAPITAKVGQTKWNTSILPRGDGNDFIAISKKVRNAENLKLGDTVNIEFYLREQ